MAKFNPFQLGRIVHPGMFAGRGGELNELEKVLLQTKNGNPMHFAIHGERGIGKSSLLRFYHWVAEGKVVLSDSPSYRFVVVTIELEPTNTYQDIVRKVGSELCRVVAGHEKAKEMIKQGWEFMKRWEVPGVKYDHAAPQSSPSPHELIEELTDSTVHAMDRLASDIDGFLITIDEADKPPSDANLGEFCKIFTERLSKRNCDRVAIGLSGLPPLFRRLRESHESSPGFSKRCLLVRYCAMTA